MKTLLLQLAITALTVAIALLLCHAIEPGLAQLGVPAGDIRYGALVGGVGAIGALMLAGELRQRR